MERLRFEELRIWQEAQNIAIDMIRIAQGLNDHRLYGISGQLERASLSISNNIAEGSGSASKRDFANFLNISKRSAYECINILMLIRKLELIDVKMENSLTRKLILLCKQITVMRKHLLTCPS